MSSPFLGLLFLFSCNAIRPDRRPTRPVPFRGQNQTAVQNKTMENSCKANPLDFVFVIDSSRSIRPSDYERVKMFIINLLKFLEVSPDGTRVGLLQYGSVVQNEFSLNTYTSKSEVMQAVRNMKHLATGTMTGLAIRYTMETAFTEAEGARPANMRVPRISMIVTDGRPQDKVEEIAAQARRAGIQIFAIGVGRVDMNTLKAIGSEPHTEHVYLVANFSQIETLISVFRSKLCEGTGMCEVVDHQCKHICVDSPTSYRCKCRSGFTLNPDGKTCKAVDLCAEVDHGCDHICANLPDGYECLCHAGYQLNPDLKTCTKIDFCDLGNHGCQHDCFSTPESYICRCMKGYILNLDGKSCSKTDYCVGGGHGCEQEFISTEDSCVCKCRKGYILQSDGKTCKSLDICELEEHGCEHQCVSTTDFYICKCLEGFTLAEDGKSCIKPECGFMDLVFVIDGSKSLGHVNFELVKRFVNSIVDSLDVSKTGTHVGLLQYSTKVRTEFTLGRYTTAKDVKQAVARMQYMGRGSMTGSALRHMSEFSFTAKEGARPDIPRVGIVFTDGRSQDDVSEWATKAKNIGIRIYAFGVGKAIEQELREIASAPDERHLYYAEDFEKMEEMTEKLKSRICKEKPSDESMCLCKNIMRFQQKVAEQLKTLTQNIEAISMKVATLETQLVQK